VVEAVQEAARRKMVEVAKEVAKDAKPVNK
jgi:hypothetical protein